MSSASTTSHNDTAVSRKEFDALVGALRNENTELKRQLDWFKRQLFGSKSEKQIEPNPYQLSLGEQFAPAENAEDDRSKQKITYERGKGKKLRPEDCVTESGLRFDASVPVKTITLPVPGLEGLSEEDFDVIGVRKSYRLAQRPASYVVLCYEQPVVKIKQSQEIINAIMAMNVLERSVADVSLLVGLLIDKFQYHIPLYRQHQRLTAAGITLSRATLTNYVRLAISLLAPIVDAQRESVLQSKVMAMDETPTKVGKSKKNRGKMHQGYYWPIYGDKDEVVFTYSDSRARRVIENILNESFSGTLLSDGYSAYASYVTKTEGITLAQCWAHTRRQFFEAQNDEPDLVAEMLARIALLYRFEAECKSEQLEGDAKREHRITHSKPVVDSIVERVDELLLERALLPPSSPFTKALGYLRNRVVELRVFLEIPEVQLDTNHLERTLRVIPMGKKNWMFSWTELGAEHVGIIQSLICTCKLHGIDPYIYLTDVLQRVGVHPAKDVAQLTPRLWKEHFAADPMQSDLMLEI